MPLKVWILPALRDNYIYVLKNESHTAVVDPSEAAPVIQFLRKKKWPLDFIFNTHHHFDHTGGNLELKKIWQSQILGSQKDKNRIPGIDKTLSDGEVFCFGKTEAKVIFIPGHTSGHIAFYLTKEKYLFPGDTLFGIGCGRLFEGSPEEMFNSLGRLKRLPKETLVYCGHEYTQANGRFALTVDKDNLSLKKRMEKVQRLREQGQPTVPFTLGEDLKTNPFLKAKTAAALADLRAQKDCF